jgi:hypothetical protein
MRGEITWSYTGVILERGTNFVRLEARFNRDDMPFQGIVLKRDDRFVECFFTDRWYNIFEIHDRDDDRIKGWYCNVGQPMVWDAPDAISYIDLALDLWVAVDGSQTVLDDDEFECWVWIKKHASRRWMVCWRLKIFLLLRLAYILSASMNISPKASPVPIIPKQQQHRTTSPTTIIRTLLLDFCGRVGTWGAGSKVGSFMAV